MFPNPPDIGKVIDSIGDGLVEVSKLPVRIAQGVNSASGAYLGEAQGNLSNIQSQLPQNPMVVPETAVKAVVQTAKLGISVVKAFGTGIQETISGVETQVRRVTG